LVKELTKFDLKHIIVLDKNVNASINGSSADRITYLKADIRNETAIKEIFNEYSPNFIFHTAAQRNPGYAESHIYETVSTNVLGTWSIVKACEETKSVRQCVFSSTGKSSRYFTEEVYAGTKKVCEYILDTYARDSRVKYSMTRFTHILENSLMNIQLRDEVKTKNFLGVHSPGKYVTAQNVKEAAYLLLNALVYAEEQRCNFLLVRHLAWPVESLEMALYYIKLSKRNIPIIFIGNPVGYSEKFFRGQLDWAHPNELNLLINVYEHRQLCYTRDEDIIISRICPVEKDVVLDVLREIKTINGEVDSKTRLIRGLKTIIRQSLKTVNKKETVEILNWGLQPKFLCLEKTQVSDYGQMIPLLFESLEGSPYYNEVESLVNHKDLMNQLD
jgi:nucleoside-diphosphate-sugar epimerase